MLQHQVSFGSLKDAFLPVKGLGDFEALEPKSVSLGVLAGLLGRFKFSLE